MPRIITGTPGSLGRAAGQAAATLYAERARADQLNREAQQLALAERRLDQQDRALDMRDRSFDRGIFESDRAFDFNTEQAGVSNDLANQRMDIAQKNAERAGAIFERDMSERTNDVGYLKQYAKDVYDLDPGEFEGMSPEGIKGALNLIEHRKALESAGERAERMRDMLYRRIGVDPAMAGQNAPGVLTDEGVAGDRMVAQIESLFSGANSIEEYEFAYQTAQGLLQQSYAEEAKQKDILRTIELRTPEIEYLKQGLPPQVASALDVAVNRYHDRDMTDEEFDKVVDDVRKLQRDIHKQMTSAMFGSVRGDFYMSASDKVGKIGDIYGSGTVAPGVDIERGEGGAPSSIGHVGRKFIDKYSKAIREQAESITDDDKRLRFVGERVKSFVRESGLNLSPEVQIMIADEIESAMSK